MELLLVKTLGSLLGVLGLMVGIVVVLRKYVYKGEPAGSSVVDVDILGHRALGPKRSVHVLRVLDKILVVGTTEGGMVSLAEISDAESLHTIDRRIAEQMKSPASFSAYVDKYLHSFTWKGMKKNGTPEKRLPDQA
jgi:flagellar biogenesis protein FliO